MIIFGYTLPDAEIEYDPLGEFEVDTPDYGTNRGVPRLVPRGKLKGEYMPVNVSEDIRGSFAGRVGRGPVTTTITDEVGMVWNVVVTGFRFSPKLGTYFVDYEFDLILRDWPTPIKSVCD